MKSEKLIKLLKTAGYKVQSYSGRGMFGKTCIAVALEQYENIGGFVANVIVNSNADRDDREELVEVFENMGKDSLGLGSVAYFPAFEWVEPEKEEEEEEEEESDDDD